IAGLYIFDRHPRTIAMEHSTVTSETLDKDDRAARLEPGVDVVGVPVEDPIAPALGVGLFSRPDRVVDNDQVGTAAGDTTAHTDGAEAAAADRLPLVLRADLAAAKASILRDAPRLAAEEIRQALVVASEHHANAWVPLHSVDRVAHRRQGRVMH